MTAEFFLYLATDDDRGDPEISVYGPFADQASAEQFEREVTKVSAENGHRVDTLLHPLVKPTAPDDAWWRDPELLYAPEVSP